MEMKARYKVGEILVSPLGEASYQITRVMLTPKGVRYFVADLETKKRELIFERTFKTLKWEPKEKTNACVF